MSPTCQRNSLSLCDSLTPFTHDNQYEILNLSHWGIDIPLDQVQCKIVRHLRVLKVHELIPVIRGAVGCPSPRKLVIDLVAHATSDHHVLYFDSWEMGDAGVIKKVFGQLLDVVEHIAMIRLIGCRTGVTDRGKDVLRAIESALLHRVKAYGTIADVNANSFENGQYGSMFMGAAAPGGEPELPGDRVPGEPWDRLTGKSRGLSTAASAQSVLEKLMPYLVGTSAFTSPGLLLRPLLSREIDCGHALRLDVLRDWKYLRVWAPNSEEAVIFKVKDRVQLENKLSSLNAQPCSAPMIPPLQPVPAL
jgi:hypothetical protein